MYIMSTNCPETHGFLLSICVYLCLFVEPKGDVHCAVLRPEVTFVSGQNLFDQLLWHRNRTEVEEVLLGPRKFEEPTQRSTKPNLNECKETFCGCTRNI